MKVISILNFYYHISYIPRLPPFLDWSRLLPRRISFLSYLIINLKLTHVRKTIKVVIIVFSNNP